MAKPTRTSRSSITKTSEVKAYVEAWQGTPQDKIPNLFDFLNTHSTVTQTERCSSYVLRDNEVDYLIPKLTNSQRENYRIRILMGVNPSGNQDVVEENPDFIPILQAAYNKTQGKYQNSKLMVIEKGTAPLFIPPSSPRNASKELLSAREGSTPFGGIPTIYEEIPQKAAYLFVVGWKRVLSQNLASPFNGIVRDGERRVQSYTYENEPSLKIYDALYAYYKIHNTFKGVQVHVYMGDGLAIPEHPFTFRPVLGITIDDSTVATVVGGTTNTYFEMAAPCPPYCGWCPPNCG